MEEYQCLPPRVKRLQRTPGHKKIGDIRGSFGQRLGGLGRRQPGLGSKLASEARGRISEDPAPSPPESTVGQEQGLLEVELHPEEQLGVFN